MPKKASHQVKPACNSTNSWYALVKTRLTCFAWGQCKVQRCTACMSAKIAGHLDPIVCKAGEARCAICNQGNNKQQNKKTPKSGRRRNWTSPWRNQRKIPQIVLWEGGNAQKSKANKAPHTPPTNICTHQEKRKEQRAIRKASVHLVPEQPTPPHHHQVVLASLVEQ